MAPRYLLAASALRAFSPSSAGSAVNSGYAAWPAWMSATPSLKFLAQKDSRLLCAQSAFLSPFARRPAMAFWKACPAAQALSISA